MGKEDSAIDLKTKLLLSMSNAIGAEEIILLLEETGFEILEKKQTIFSLNNIFQEIKDGVGEGIFAVIKARCMTNI